MNRTYPTISRQEFQALIQKGWTWRIAGLYEPQHAGAKACFVHVQLAPGHTTFYRMTKP